ncbi:MAG: hypothetical protein JRH07_06510 [Deltaproteobacteria bacterium]|nr:hypothetical protein [Deltaproteobacteria bacterium]MBW2121486.1 hypothetical protein [Deltaproteobacteria bacterium]
MALRLAEERGFVLCRLAESLRLVVRSLPDFLLEGGVSIDTEAPPRAGQGGGRESLLFRTVIQADGDIINLMRGPDGSGYGPAGLRSYEETYEVHRAKVRTFLASLERLKAIPLALNTVFGFFLALVPARGLLLDQGKAVTYVGLLIAWILLVALLQRFLARYLLRVTIGYLLRRRT